MLKANSIFAASTFLGACAVIPTFGSVSKTPMQLPNGELAYRYEGRANFPHQQEVADKMMAEQCASVNGGMPIIVDAQQMVIGAAAFGSSNTSLTGTAAQRTYNATTNTTSSGSTLANKQQQIIFRCIKG